MVKKQTIIFLILAFFAVFALGFFAGKFLSPRTTEAIFQEKDTVFEGGKGTIAEIDKDKNEITITMMNPNYGGGEKKVESIYQKKILTVGPSTRLIKLVSSVDSTSFFVPDSQEEEIGLDDLKAGDRIDFVARNRFEFYNTKKIEAQKISKVSVD